VLDPSASAIGSWTMAAVGTPGTNGGRRRAGEAKITIEGHGQKSLFRAKGIGEGRGEAFNPVTGEDHFAQVHLGTGVIWKKGECGQGTFRAAAGVSITAEKTNWMILYKFDWANCGACQRSTDCSGAERRSSARALNRRLPTNPLVSGRYMGYPERVTSPDAATGSPPQGRAAAGAAGTRPRDTTQSGLPTCYARSITGTAPIAVSSASGLPISCWGSGVAGPR